ncbi:amino acid adenylation domain-containing protein [Alkalispirillum mobile]|uniref:Amino acid adenylation domain-containing protein n=2 Tax=Alkalispirillum mobile TaxID=85925 RepID=A0A498C8W7_9GAMM|nr:amino acid adenylation domain-containing protein [Alkalispirillum mobile]
MSLDDSRTRPWLRGSLHTGSAAEPSEVSQRAVPTREVPLPFTTMDVDHTVPGRFERVAQRFGDRLAVRSPTTQWTYAQLEQRANGIAQAIYAACPEPGTRVGLLFPHDAPMVAAMLGALKAGATYVPLDPALPSERLQFMLADSEASLLLTDGDNATLAASLAQESQRVIKTDDLDNSAPLTSTVGPDDYAYILYTSGSTGQPKGILQSHRNLLHHIRVWTEALDITHRDRMSLASAFTWDSSLQDAYGALLNGATSYIFDVRDQGFDRLADLVVAERLTICHLAVPVYRNLMRVLARRQERPAVRAMALGADMVHQADMDAFREWFPDEAILVNAYGATESTTGTIYRIDKTTQVPCYPLPIGTPVDNTAVTLVGDDGHPVDPGDTGEITLTSRHVALGYLNKPELTAEKFQRHEDVPHVRTYRTGDLGRQLPDGNLILLGRRDNQVKVRGIRVDLGEVESALVQHPDIQEAIVLDVAHPSGDKRLVGYIVPRANKAPATEQVRAFLGERLPEYMLPSSLIVLEAMPLTPNGKIDRKAMPAPDWRARNLDTPYLAPRDTQEALLAEVFSEVLGVEPIGVNDNFFALGGDSIQALNIVLTAEARGLRITPHQVFSHPTVAQLAYLDRETPRPDEAGPTQGRAANDQLAQWNALRQRLPEPDQVDQVYPLSPTQKGIYFQCLMARKDSGIYKEQTRLTLSGQLDPDLFAAAWDHLIACHAVLRTAFVRRGLGQPHQVVQHQAPVPLEIRDWRERSASEEETALKRLEAEEIRQGFKLGQAPLMRLVLVRTGAHRHELIWTYHHIILDGWSESLLIQDLLGTYDALHQGREPNLPARAPYRDFIQWVHNRSPGEGPETFWKDLLRGFKQPATMLAEAIDQSSNDPIDDFATATIDLDGQALDGVSRQFRVSVSTLMQGIWAAVLAQACNTDDVVYGTIASGREQGPKGIADMIGLTVNTLPMRVRLTRYADISDWLQDLQRGLLEVRQHATSDLGDIERLSEVSSDRLPLFESTFVYLNLPGIPQDGQGALTIEQRAYRSVPHFPLTLFVEPGNRLRIRAAYRQDAFSRAYIEALLNAVQALSSEITQGSPRRLEDWMPAAYRALSNSYKAGRFAVPGSWPVNR